MASYTSHNSPTVFPSATLSLGADTNQIIVRKKTIKGHQSVNY